MMVAARKIRVKSPRPRAGDEPWVDTKGVYVLALVTGLVAIALAIVNSSILADVARNTADIAQIKAHLVLPKDK